MSIPVNLTLKKPYQEYALNCVFYDIQTFLNVDFILYMI